MSVKILTGDCRQVLATLPAESVHSIVTDPPYGIGFMGKEWDHKNIVARAKQRAGHAQPKHRNGTERTAPRRALAEEAGAYDLSPAAMRAFQSWTAEWAAQAIRVLKPGGIVLCFASTRTYHRMACGLEDAGFEVFDQIGWLFGSGFPKNHDFAKDQEASKAAGARVIKAEFTGHQMAVGFGTALKPGWEPIAVARKPISGTYAENVLLHGCGALNIDGCRVETEDHIGGGAYSANGNRNVSGSLSPTGMNRAGATAAQEFVQPKGRWPANVVHDGSDEVLAAFPSVASGIPSGTKAGNNNNVFGQFAGGIPVTGYGDAGSAARFYYCAKASKADREAGCDGLPTKRGGMVSNTSGQHMTRRDGGEPGQRANHHPTVKPTELMRWLVRLVTPPGGAVLDPFLGSGSTARAASIDGFDCIGIELDPEYVAIAKHRVSGDAPLFADHAASGSAGSTTTASASSSSDGSPETSSRSAPT
jgi:site-specific DNA-methyltransferase (adenine-specific)